MPNTKHGERSNEDRAPEGSWRDQGDGGYFEPSRGRWDDDRRSTRSRQDQLSDGPHGFGGSYGRGAGRYTDLAHTEPVSDRGEAAETSTSGNKPKSGSRLP